MQRFFALGRKMWEDGFLRRSGGYFLGSMVVAVLNYAYHPVVSRLLSLRDFGDVQAAFSLATQLTTVLGAFTLATVHASVNADDSGHDRAVMRLLRRVALGIVGIFILGLTLGAKTLAEHFQFASPTVLFALAAFLVSTVLYSVRLGYLQGKAQFLRVSLASMLVSGGRLAFAVLFIWLGWRAFGAMAGFVAAQAVALSLVAFWTRDHLSEGASRPVPVLDRRTIVRELLFVGFIACSTAFITLLYTGDVLLVKRWFSPELAGAYSGIATIAKITIFATGPFAAVLLSSIKRRGGSIDEQKRLFLKAVGLVTLVGGGATVCFALLPRFFTGFLIGARYMPWAHLLPWLAGAFFFVSLANLACNLGLALRRLDLLGVIASGSVGLVALLAIHHGSLEAVAQAFFGAGAIAAMAGALFAHRVLAGAHRS